MPDGSAPSGRAQPGRISAVVPAMIGLADAQAERRQDVALFASLVFKQRDAGGAVRIVFDRGNGGRNIAQVALEVNDPVIAFFAAARWRVVRRPWLLRPDF